MREKGQITIPKAIIEAAGLKVGDQLTFIVDGINANLIWVHRPPASYIGALRGVYGTTPEEVRAYLREEEEAWEEGWVE